MKYNEFIHINENFRPVFDLENETEDNKWSLFIPNNKFRDVLSAVIDSMDIQSQKNSVWLQGTYGTGKSHATSVIKHLLCDDEIDFELGDNQLTGKLNSFRDKNNVFPVILKGTSTIGTLSRFRSTIQSAVKKALKLNDMRVTIPSDFEHMISLINDGTINLKDEDIEGTKLEAYPKDEIILRLENEESEILIELEDILLKKGLSPFAQQDIVEWLSAVKDELKKEYDIDYLMLFWDEFTGALNLVNVEEILLEVQNIAEAKHKGISLFIVSHRTRSTQSNISDDKIEKIMDRFQRKHYSMEPIATYELMERSIKKDKDVWEGVKNRLVAKITPLIDNISVNEGPTVKKALENLYPIHPYTAYLATFIAQEIGSTERSIFRFLHDDIEFGFKSFIDTFEIKERFFLTAEYLWDFFYYDFDQREDERISSALNRYKSRVDSLKALDEEYLTVFKVVLLLNILYKIAEVDKSSLAVPSRDNINNVFIGSIYENKVDSVLNYIDENGIINETPDHLFELTTNALSTEQINKELNKLKQNSKLKDLLNSSKLNEISENISRRVIREMELKLLMLIFQKID